MPTLHHFPLLAGSRFVRLILAEYGEEVVLVEEAPWQRSAELLKLNPAGELPIFVDDDGTTVAGAAIIAEYLAETRGARVGEQTLMPASPADRAETRRLSVWFLSNQPRLQPQLIGFLLNALRDPIFRVAPIDRRNSHQVAQEGCDIWLIWIGGP